MSFLLLLWVCAAGALLARRLDEAPTRLIDTLALGAALGLAGFAAFGFILGWAFGLSATTVIAAAALTTAVSLGLGVRPRVLFAESGTRPRAAVIVLAVFTAILVGRLADRALFRTPTGIATGDRHNFGDLPFHMGITAGFAYGNNFPPDHPELAGVPLTYPFFGDLVSGMILAMDPRAERLLGLQELKRHVYRTTISTEQRKPEEFNLFRNRDRAIAEACGQGPVRSGLQDWDVATGLRPAPAADSRTGYLN